MATFLDVRAWIERTYGVRNHGKGIDVSFASVDTTLSHLSKSIRKNTLEPSSAAREIARLVARIFALERLLKVDIIQGMQKKYPGYCQYCWYFICRCGRRQRAEAPPPGAKPPNDTEAITQWQFMFNGIYGFANAQKGPEHILLHIFEEIAEVRDARLNDPASVEEELSDVLAHVIGLANVLGIEIEAPITERYAAGCSECHRKVCGC